MQRLLDDQKGTIICHVIWKLRLYVQFEESLRGSLQQKLLTFKKTIFDQIHSTLNHSNNFKEKLQGNCKWKANLLRNYKIMACGAFLSLNIVIN